MSSYDLMQGFRPAKTGADWARNFRQAFPDHQANGVVVMSGGKTVQIKIGRVNEQNNMLNPDAAILLEQNARGEWDVTSLFLKEGYYDSHGPSGRLLDLETVVIKDKNINFSIGRLIDAKASGRSFHEAVSAGDNMRHISGFIEDVESGRIMPHQVKVTGVAVSGYPQPLDPTPAFVKI